MPRRETRSECRTSEFHVVAIVQDAIDLRRRENSLRIIPIMEIGFAAGLQGDPNIVNRSYDLFSPGYAGDLSVAWDGIQIMLDDDIHTGLVDRKFTLDRVINDRILKQAQQELRNEGRLKQ